MISGEKKRTHSKSRKRAQLQKKEEEGFLKVVATKPSVALTGKKSKI